MSATPTIAAAALGESKAAWPALDATEDPWLDTQLSESLSRIGLGAPMADHRLAVALVDITDPERPRMAGINEHLPMYAASLPKIAILFGAFHKADAGLLSLDSPTRDRLTQMIRASSNSAATEMIERVGFDYLAKLLQSDEYKLYDPTLNGGLWVGKPYAKNPAWKRDPVNNLSHAATAFEVARFYYLLETGRLVSPEDCEEMKKMLSEPAINHKFVRGLEAYRPGSKIFRKSGTWRTFHSDSAVVERDGRRYIAVALANDANGGKWLSELIVAADELIFTPTNIARDTSPRPKS